MNSALIIGAGGYGRELCQLLVSSGWSVAGFVDTVAAAEATLERPILGDDRALAELRRQFLNTFIAVGDLERRRSIHARLSDLGFVLPVFIHPSAYVARSATLGEGSVVYPNASIMHRVSLGRCALVNANASIGHDTTCGDFSTLNPNCAVAGNVSIGNGVFIGAGAIVIERLRVTDQTVIGAGAVVIRDITTAGTHVGNPARRLP